MSSTALKKCEDTGDAYYIVEFPQRHCVLDDKNMPFLKEELLKKQKNDQHPSDPNEKPKEPGERFWNITPHHFETCFRETLKMLKL